MKNKSRKRAFTLTEIAIVFGIVGVIIAAVWTAAANVYSNQKISAAESGIVTTAHAVHSMYANSDDTGMTAATNVTTAGMFPVAWSSTTAGMVGNPWHVNPTVNTSYITGNGSIFAVELDGIPDAACVALISAYNSTASNGNGGLVPGLIGNNASTTAIVGGTPTLLAKTLAGFNGVPSQCNSGGNLDSVNIVFDMSKM
jgi:type II secretory pathway pseudopilin PulG